MPRGIRERAGSQLGATPVTRNTDVPRRIRKRTGWLLGATLVMVALSPPAIHVGMPMFRPERPAADIRSPATGERIARPQNVDIRLHDPVRQDGTIWLGYQNERGGPFIIQASTCAEIEDRLDCGPLYVGHDEKDTSQFRIFLAAADASATAILSAHGRNSVVKPGDNVSYPNLPTGTKIISEERRIALR